ncbi:uncharacterized protein LOC144331607 isoform X2 [Macaca mulatta]
MRQGAKKALLLWSLHSSGGDRRRNPSSSSENGSAQIPRLSDLKQEHAVPLKCGHIVQRLSSREELMDVGDAGFSADDRPGRQEQREPKAEAPATQRGPRAPSPRRAEPLPNPHIKRQFDSHTWIPEC